MMDMTALTASAQTRAAIDDAKRAAVVGTIGDAVDKNGSPITNRVSPFANATVPSASALSVAIDGPGLFVLQDGARRLYGRLGNFRISHAGALVDANDRAVIGFRLNELERPISGALPIALDAADVASRRFSEFVIDDRGVLFGVARRVAARTGRAADTRVALAQIALAIFPSPERLARDSQTTLLATPAAGLPRLFAPGEANVGMLRPHALENGLVDVRGDLEKEVFDRAAELPGLETDLLFFDTTSTYFVTEEADAPVARDQQGNPVPEGAAGTREAGFRTWGKSKDHRDDLPQVVIGMAVTRTGIPVRVWCWPGNTSDSALIRQVKDDMRDWSLSRVVWVADRGFTSAENRRYLRKGGSHYIIGEKLRGDSAEAAAALSRTGRYHTVAGNLEVKEVVVDDAVMVSLLRRHGCTIEHTTVHFPAVTVAQEIWPRCWTMRYTVFLPDGVKLLWRQGRSLPEPAQSLLYVTRELYEQEQKCLADQEALNGTEL